MSLPGKCPEMRSLDLTREETSVNSPDKFE